MRPARHGFDDFGLVATGDQLVGLAGLHVAELEPRLALDHQKLLGFGVVVVATARNARVRREIAELPAVGRLEHFGKYPAWVAVHGHGVGKGLYRQIADISGVQRPQEPRAHALGHQGLAAVLERLDGVRQLAHGGGVLRRHGGKALGIQRGIGAVHDLHKARNHVIHIHQRDRRCRVVDGNGQVAGNVVAKRGYRRVVIGLAPLSKHIGQTKHMHRHPMRALQRKQRVFCRALALAIGVVALSLGGRGVDHRHLLTRAQCHIGNRSGQRLCQVGIAGCKLCRVLRAVHPGEVNDKVHPIKQRWQFGHGVGAGKATHL